MSEFQIKLTGWQAIAGIILLVVILGVRIMTFGDKTGDSALKQKVEFQILMEYFPEDVENLKSVYEAGDMDATSEAVESITSTKVNVESIQTSSPLLSFSTNEKVVVKVMYSLDDSYGNREKGTAYYLFKHGALGNTWSYRYDTSALMYYLNFM